MLKSMTKSIFLIYRFSQKNDKNRKKFMKNAQKKSRPPPPPPRKPFWECGGCVFPPEAKILKNGTLNINMWGVFQCATVRPRTQNTRARDKGKPGKIPINRGLIGRKIDPK